MFEKMYVSWFLLSLILQIGYLPEVYSVSGKEFPVDDHIGTAQLFEEGSYISRGSSEYTIDLLPAEASTEKEVVLRGYYMGFQWNSHASVSEDTKVNIQLYRQHSLDHPRSWMDPFRVNEYDGTYVLAYETGWINSKPGKNLFYFNKSVTLKKSAINRGGVNYVIGIMADRLSPNPIIKQDCLDREKISILAQTGSRPYIGQEVHFRYTGSYNGDCTTFSIQGLYLSTEFVDDKYNCTMYIASLDEPVEVASILGADVNQHECHVVRASTEDYGLSVTSDYFTVYDCFSYYVDIGDYSKYFSYKSTGEYKKWDTYCSDVFGEKSTNRPYIMFSSYLATYMQYKFTVVAKEPPNIGLIVGITFAVIVVLMLIAFIVTVVICVKHNKKRTVNRPVTGTSHAPYPRQQMPPSATATHYQPQEYRDQPSAAPPPNYSDATS